MASPVIHPRPLVADKSMPLPPESFQRRAWQNQVIAAAANFIADHYRLPLGGVFEALEQVERDCEAETGLRRFGALLETRRGFAVIGTKVAELLLGHMAAKSASPLALSQH